MSALVAPLDPEPTVVSGGAPGAHTIAEEAAKRYDRDTVVHRAEWRTDGKPARSRRNGHFARKLAATGGSLRRTPNGGWRSVDRGVPALRITSG